ncbi:MAG: hypothetical protein CVT90_01150, partial [Candidatus Altiarchaeales archaeon HGW-Altiarchaeales-3]
MRCALTIRGNVQDVGYRKIIEANAISRQLRGYVFNDIDGTVKLVCDAEVCVVEDFVDAINIHRGNIFVQEINKIEIKDVSFPLPETFVRLQTDDLKDIGRKLDKGNVFLEYLGIGQDKLVEGQ